VRRDKTQGKGTVREKSEEDKEYQERRERKGEKTGDRKE
jgi:hypothetical protein